MVGESENRHYELVSFVLYPDLFRLHESKMAEANSSSVAPWSAMICTNLTRLIWPSLPLCDLNALRIICALSSETIRNLYVWISMWLKLAQAISNKHSDTAKGLIFAGGGGLKISNNNKKVNLLPYWSCHCLISLRLALPILPMLWNDREDLLLEREREAVAAVNTWGCVLLQQ